MDLVVSATPFEVTALKKKAPASVQFLVAGVGLVETTYNLVRYLSKHPEVKRVINVGIAGAFPTADLNLLDGCLARSETIADLGICFDSHLQSFESEFLHCDNVYSCENASYTLFKNWLQGAGYSYSVGGFLSVNGVSGSTARGVLVNRTHCICENMEGAAVARVCSGFELEWLEFRTISNFVEDRDHEKWQIQPAITRLADIVGSFLGDHAS